MRKLSLLTLLLLLAVPVLPQSRKAPAKKPASTTRKKSPAPKKKSATAKKPVSKSRPATRTTRSRVSRPRGQQVPTPQRYAEIQQALIDRGYLSGPSTGKWGPDSAEALRKFQEDQNLEPTGKLDSLSLIALGLGPSRDNTIPSPPESKKPQ